MPLGKRKCREYFEMMGGKYGQEGFLRCPQRILTEGASFHLYCTFSF